MTKAKDKERLGIYFNMNDEKEKALWDYLDSKFSKSVAVKEALKQAMEIEKAGQKAFFTPIENEISKDDNCADIEDYGVEQNDEF